MKELIAAAVLPGALMAASGMASGTLTVNGQAVQMKYAYAARFPDWFDKTKLGTRLVVSDMAIPVTAIQDSFEMMSLARDGKMNAIQFEIGASRNSISMSIHSNKLQGSVSVSKNFDAKAIPVFTEDRLEGALAAEASTMGPMSYAYDVKFATAIAPRVVTAPPTAADTAAAAKAGSAQAYLAFVAAVRAGNKAKMLELASPKVRQMMDKPDFAEKLSLVQEMMPAKIQVLKAEENGDEAKLTVSGVEDGKTKQGTVTMMRQDGKWYLVKESWRSQG
jgi:hypothetical protein